MTWYAYAILGMFLFGAKNFSYKICAERGYDSGKLTFYFVIIPIPACIFLLLQRDAPLINLSWYLIALAVGDAIAYYTTTVGRMEALKYAPTSVVYPLVRMSTAVLIVWGLLVLDESLTLQQWIGVLVAAGAVFLLTRKTSHIQTPSPNLKKGLLLCLIALLGSAAANMVSKAAADAGDIILYMLLANSLISLISLSHTKAARDFRTHTKPEIILGLGTGVVDVASWYCHLMALQLGDLAAVSVINSLYFVIPILLSMIVYKEKVDRVRMAGIILAAVSVILMKL